MNIDWEKVANELARCGHTAEQTFAVAKDSHTSTTSATISAICYVFAGAIREGMKE